MRKMKPKKLNNLPKLHCSSAWIWIKFRVITEPILFVTESDLPPNQVVRIIVEEWSILGHTLHFIKILTLNGFTVQMAETIIMWRFCALLFPLGGNFHSEFCSQFFVVVVCFCFCFFVAHAILELTIHLPQPPECWDYRCIPQCSVADNFRWPPIHGS
jgi:hypothetical protein